ncbi:unnamed protein product [Acanthoscelides obtectus]|uniref:C3H1-type domain-containing protein n=1 Tax=Acanthoscelides obtectus TaxID=200917 RepID=A0A9P0PM04_ACAOB|nr:unnamed protein product [Acanthoscelides obtectus]CAK1662723.1 Protein suppressor of sable [Acanthoscelides obtectus]
MLIQRIYNDNFKLAVKHRLGSNNIEGEQAPKTQEEIDLEEGEIDDDDEETPEVRAEDAVKAEPVEAPKVEPSPTVVTEKPTSDKEVNPEKEFRPEKTKDRRRHGEKGKNKKHMTEAERSILHLRKREEMQRRKWEKFSRNKDLMDGLDDDFAKNIEKTLATILSKKEKEAAALGSGGEEKVKEETEVDSKRGKKRKKGDKERKRKHHRTESPPPSDPDEGSLSNHGIMMGIGGDGTPDHHHEGSPSVHSEDSRESAEPSERRSKKRERRNKEHRKASRIKEQQQDKSNEKVCVFYLQGKCLKNDCPYSHEAVPPMKLELCKFYLMDCCAKGDKCSYMHSEFPCKFYHTGLNCTQDDNCKFAHGKPLSDGLKQILFKHIETAPRDILGGFPRLNRDEVLNMINVTQAKLQQEHGMPVTEPSMLSEAKGGIPSLFDITVPCPPELIGYDGKMDKQGRNRPSRWQDTENGPGKMLGFPMKTFVYGQDQDMRINSIGDVDMRTLPPPPITSIPPPMTSIPPPTTVSAPTMTSPAISLGLSGDVDIRPTPSMLNPQYTQDVDIRHTLLGPPPRGDVDIRHLGVMQPVVEEAEDEPMLQIDTGEDKDSRMQTNQRDNTAQNDNKGFELDENINWYSDDDDEDDNRLTIKVDNEDLKEREEQMESLGSTMLSPPQIQPIHEVVEKLGDLSKIDISAEVTKLLTSMSQNKGQFSNLFPQKAPGESSPGSNSTKASGDPRSETKNPVSRSDPRQDPRLAGADPRQRSRQGSTEVASRSEKVSIYEQGSIERSDMGDDVDIDFRTMRSDVDLRNLHLPFKGMANYTPASEIDASINSHPPMQWKVTVCDVPRPDYTGLKLNVSDAEKTGDPRLRKIFRLSIEERDTPLSPKASPKAGSASTRVDPRLRKTEETKISTSMDTGTGTMNFNQQLTILQNSAFYQSLTSNQKLLLNQELNQRNDSSNSHDPVLNTLLSNLNIIPGSNMQSNPNLGAALSILANVAKLNPMQAVPNMLNQMSQAMGQPGLLGAAPGIPNIPPDFPMGFDPRNGGLMGNVPPMPFGGGGFNNQDTGPGPGGNFNNFNDDFYEGGGPGPGGNFRENRGGFNRDRRRGRHFRGRDRGGFRNNRNNRPNRTHSPP